jgi:MarR family transcriptional regulator, organic hydroperoxide resistance regulator
VLRSYLAYLLAEAERQVNRGLAEALAGESVTVEQWRILQALSDGLGHSMSELAAAVLMPSPTLTKAIDRLVDDALVYRRQDDTDRRRVAVFLSDQGRALAGRLDRRVRAHDRTLRAAYGDQRTERLMRELTRLKDVLA